MYMCVCVCSGMCVLVYYTCVYVCVKARDYVNECLASMSVHHMCEMPT